MMEAGRHPNIEILAYSTVERLEGHIGRFVVRVKKKARYVKEDVCNACGECAEKCPIKVPDDFDMKMRKRRAIYLYFAQGIPAVMTIDKENCRYFYNKKCGLCAKICQQKAVDWDQQDEEVALDAKAIVVATGLDIFDPSGLTQYGYGRIKNVITAMEYERLINATGPTQGHLLRPSDGKLAERVGYVQCVGSRDQNNCNYCSSVCCMYSIKDAMLAREHDPNSQSFIFHTDFRNVGKWFQNYEKRGKEQYGIEYIRGRVAEIVEGPQGDPILWYEDTRERKVKSQTVNLAVLAIAAKPSRGSRELARILGIALDDNGFVKTDPFYPADTSIPGIFACGFCAGPADIPESVSQASTAAARVAECLYG